MTDKQLEQADTGCWWAVMSLCGQNFLVAATDKGLCYLQYADHDAGENEEALFHRWAASRTPGTAWVQDSSKLEPYAAQIEAYLQGEPTAFELPFDLRGTSFQKKVWQKLLDIPYGATCSYSEIADALGQPRAVRAVGTAIGANPVLIAVPCHRVLGKNGSLTGYRGGLANKERLLRLEKNGMQHIIG